MPDERRHRRGAGWGRRWKDAWCTWRIAPLRMTMCNSRVRRGRLHAAQKKFGRVRLLAKVRINSLTASARSCCIQWPAPSIVTDRRKSVTSPGMLRDRESDVARPDREQRWNVNPHTVQAGLELPVSIQVAVVIQA